MREEAGRPGATGESRNEGSSTPLGTPSYTEAVSATLVTGAGSIAVVAAGVARSKVIALGVGPEGIGLFGILSSTLGLITTIAGLGLGSSGVRQVAAARTQNDPEALGRVLHVLRRLALTLGVVGTVVVALFSSGISALATGSTKYSGYLLIMSPMILFGTLSGAEMALLRGLRRMKILAQINVLSAVAAAVSAIPLVYFWGLGGIPLSLVLPAGVTLLASWWCASNVETGRPCLSAQQFKAECAGIVGLGVAFLSTGVMLSIVQVSLRVILQRQTDLQAVGQYVAAVTLSQVYVAFILDAMALDYLPRLSAVKTDSETTNRLVNEQTEIALLLGGGGVVALTVIAPVLIPLLYSSRFTEATAVLRWQCLGVLLQLVNWPIGTVFIANGLKKHFVGTQASTNVVYVGAFFVLAKSFGLTGAAMAFAIAQAFYLVLTLYLVAGKTGFSWSEGVREILLRVLGGFALVLAAHEWLPRREGFAAGSVVCVLLLVSSYRRLSAALGRSPVAFVLARVQARVPSAFRGQKGQAPE